MESTSSTLIKVGDRVRVSGGPYEIERHANWGRVIAVDPPGSILVEHDEAFADGHNENRGGSPLVRGGHCWWYSERDLTVVPPAPVEEISEGSPMPEINTAEALTTAARKVFPHGHPRFAQITVSELELHSVKNHDYAAGGDPLGNFKRVAAFFAQYPGLRLSDPAVVAMAYAMKQVDAYFWLKSNGHEAKVEGIAKRLPDISVYTKLAQILEEEKG